jgi:hypothetical protein
MPTIEATKRLYTYENDFKDFVDHKNNFTSVPLEIDEEMFDYWLGVLPPTGANHEENGESMLMFGMGGQWVRKDGTLQRFVFAFAEGYETITVFWTNRRDPQAQAEKQPTRYFAQRTAILNRRG